jgi:membrane-associated protein
VASSLLDAVGRLSVTVLYLAAFGLAFGEAAFLLDILVPGEVGLVVAGAAGEARGAMLPVLCLLGATGAVLGDSVSWWIGHRFGTRLVQRWAWTERILGPQLEKASDVLSRRGGVAIFAARWIGALRALVPLVAGAAGVPYRTVLVWDAPAALLWGSTAVCLGWFLGEPVAETVDRLGGWISIVVVGVLALVLVVRRRKGSRR